MIQTQDQYISHYLNHFGMWSGRLVPVSAWLLVAVLMIPPQQALAIGENCTVQATSVTFGTYDPFSSSPNDAAGNVRVTCTNPLSVSVLVNYTVLLSTGGSGSYAPRAMRSGVRLLTYNVYTNSSHTTVWGDSSNGTSAVSDGYTLAVLGSVVRNYPVYGRISAGQNAFVGSYDDSLTVTINF